MRQELEAGVKVKTETETKKLVGKVHPPHMRWKTVQVKNGLQLMKTEGIQKTRLREGKNFAFFYEGTKNVTKFQVSELSVPK